MELGLGILSLLIGYLAGSLSFSRIITKMLAPEVDLAELKITMETAEDEKIPGVFGANAASMVGGTKWGLIVAVLDILKAVVPMLVIKILFKGEPYYLFSGFGGLLGHNWPIYYGFKGGRGFAVIVGSFFVIDWIAPIATTFAGLFLGMVVLGNQMLGSILWMWLMIPWTIWRGGKWEILYTITVNIVFLLGAIPEIKSMQRLKKSGIYQEYQESMYQASPRWRGMKKMTDRLWIFRPLFERKKTEIGTNDPAE